MAEQQTVPEQQDAADREQLQEPRRQTDSGTPPPDGQEGNRAEPEVVSDTGHASTVDRPDTAGGSAAPITPATTVPPDPTTTVPPDPASGDGPIATDPPVTDPPVTDPPVTGSMVAGPAAAEPSAEPAADVDAAAPTAPDTGAVTEPSAAPDPAPSPAVPPIPSPAPVPPRPTPPRPGPPPRPAPPRAAPAHEATPVPAVDSPTGAAEVPHASPVAAASADPGRWGRIDAEGTIYVRTADGERPVGSWQAGAPEEGLAHFARRFDDMLTEVELLATRLAAGSGDPKHTIGAARTLRDGLDEATVVGDMVGLRARLDDLIVRAEVAVGAARSAREAQRGAAVARKEELSVEAEALSLEATQWKQAGDRFTQILDEWRTIRGIDRKTDELLWKRFSKAREAFNRRRGSHFADLDRQRAGAKAQKEALVVEAEKLADSDDWGPTAARFRDLMTEWKAAGRAAKDSDDALWGRFRGAQDAFFARRSATLAERDAEFVANGEAKKALLVEAEKIDGADAAAARAALRNIQERWEEIGKVPRDDIRGLEARLRAVEEKVRESVDRQWRRTDPEAEARLAQFRDRVAQYEAQAVKARAGGNAKRAADADAQATQWREWLQAAEQAVQHR